MNTPALKTAVLGLGQPGVLMLEVAKQSGFFDIVAVADGDAALAEKAADEYKCAAFDDYRQLIVQNQLDCLLVSAGIQSCDEYLRLALKRKCNVFKQPPLANNFEQAAEMVRLAEDNGVAFAIANPGRFADSFLQMHQFIRQQPTEQFFLITAVCTASRREYPLWQNDPNLAGGGVLLYDCYGIIDQLIWNFDIPRQVYSLTASIAADRQQRLYLTEDIAVVNLKFSDTLFAGVVASRVFGPPQRLLKVCGKDSILSASSNEFIISDKDGLIIRQSCLDDDHAGCMSRAMENFALSIISPDKSSLCSSARENLGVMAVIESAYLSARTAMPEEPDRILEMAPVRGSSSLDV